MLYGVDIHGQYQAGIDFPTLARQGYTFAVTKASQGTGFRAPRFVEWIGKTRAAGMIPGAYHWIEKGNAVAQVAHFLKVLADVGGPNGLLIQLDCEDNATWADVQAWAAEWKRRTNGHPFLLYSGKWWWGAAGRQWPGSSITPYLWESHYLAADTDSVPDDPAAFAARIPASWWTPGYGGWKAATILQFSSKGDAGKLANKVDLNATKLTREQLLKLTQPPAPPTKPPTEPEKPDIEEDRMPTVEEIVKGIFAHEIPGTETPDYGDGKKLRTFEQVCKDLYNNGPKGLPWPQSTGQQILDAVEKLAPWRPPGPTATTDATTPPAA